jgi:hypothetical protein
LLGVRGVVFSWHQRDLVGKALQRSLHHRPVNGRKLRLEAKPLALIEIPSVQGPGALRVPDLLNGLAAVKVRLVPD